MMMQQHELKLISRASVLRVSLAVRFMLACAPL
jgi:hypothetical protein